MEAAEAVSGVDVGRLEVEDRDLPGSPNWAARFTILEGDPDGQFTIRTDPRTNEGVLSVVKPLDYESRERYDLKVAVQNEAPLQAAAPRAERSQARVSVQVRDVNEAPVFQENPLRTSLAEGAAPGTPVATFSARDPDTQQPQRLSYSKDYDPEDWLQVDGATGQVQTQRVLSPASPFLKDGWYRAIILAQDDASPPSTATGTLSIEILEVNDHAPELSPPWGSLCSTPDRGSGLLLGATDEDLPPHGAPFHFQLSPRVPELARNWSLSQVNGTYVTRAEATDADDPETDNAALRYSILEQGGPQLFSIDPLTGEIRTVQVGLDREVVAVYNLTLQVADMSGDGLTATASAIITLEDINDNAPEFTGDQQSWDKRLLHGLQDDLRDNILNYDEQGGGEEDQDAYDMDQLRHPAELAALGPSSGRPPLRRDAPFGRARPQVTRALPTSPADIADFINDASPQPVAEGTRPACAGPETPASPQGLEAADSDPSVPPYDTALIYDYEGDGSVAGTLSSILSSLDDEDQDYSCLREWGPRFSRLADLYGPP
ncbi:hypothetical protein Celaphus_00004056 [Cervus elaphus hippelaphus]|uniref:Cadherin domain-containing protein n=1 Tax=Cervus elaphus hippelaphus TaxID=46360 RepID=A0A212DC80_CEREH|nr:hypothetical protein Celaphus_00004056 [Cervus elaphus hippelaphus]